MYQGLLAAPARDFAMPALEASKAPALPDPAVDSQLRQDRLVRLAQRLEDLESEDMDEVDERAEAPTPDSLAARLRRRRAESDDALELVPVEAAPTALLPSSATARAVIDHLEAVLPRDGAERTPTSLAGLDGPLSRGLLARGEWNDLILACVRLASTL